MPRRCRQSPSRTSITGRPKAKYDEIYTGWAYPPKDYGKWAELVFQWTKHCVEKYGKEPRSRRGTGRCGTRRTSVTGGARRRSFKLHDYAADAVKRALPTARVGGPEPPAGRAGSSRVNSSSIACAARMGPPGRLARRSISSRSTPRARRGSWRGTCGWGSPTSSATIDAAFSMVASYPELKDKPIVIGESDPDGCAACQGPQLGYRNGTMYASYTAASFARKYELADRHGVNLEGALTWAFTFEKQPYFAGFRQLATNGIDLPVLNVFRMFGKMGGQRVAVHGSADAGLDRMLKEGVRGAMPDVSALAALEPKRLAVLVWHYHDDDVPGPAADIELKLDGLPEAAAGAGATVRQYRIEHDHSNAYTAWLAMGSPQEPTGEQYAAMERAGQLAELGEASPLAIKDGSASVRVTLPRQAVTLLVIEWK
jgi:xylan 1,4-beta-xylosidase